MQTYCALVELRKIQDLMHGFSGIYFGWAALMNVEGLSSIQLAISTGRILRDHAEVLDAKLADWHRHPATLIPVVMNRRSLAHVPADRHQLEQFIPEDQIARVVFVAEENVWLQSGFIHAMVLKVIVDGSH